MAIITVNTGSMPAGPRVPEVVLNKVDAFLQSRYPGARFLLAPGVADGDHGFMVFPMARITEPGDEAQEIRTPDAQRLNEIADALEDFRAAGWKRMLH